MTHEEIVTTHIAQVVRSYRDLPLILYHFQTKERDEPRPRAGVLRTREFIMKDSYTFDRDAAGLDVGYEKHREAYDKIFDRCGLEWYRVDSDVGMMGGTGAHEYMAPCPAGENDVALAPGYAANVEVATADAEAGASCRRRWTRPEAVDDAGREDDRGGRAARGRPGGRADQGLPDHRRRGRAAARARPRRPSRQRDQARQHARRAVPARAAGRVRGPDRPGGLHRPGRDRRPDPARCRAATATSYIAGANKADAHLRGVSRAATSPSETVDVRTVEAGDTVDGHEIRIEPAIEIGNIFKLGTRYSVPLGATYLDEDGTSKPIWMGSYGIGPARICAAAVEQFADEKGISWPRALAPFDIHLVGLGKPDTPERALADKLYEELRAARPRRASTTTAPAGRARSSPTPSCSAARCG